ncbi:DUF3579 domain-containing protein [Bordetella genomosp. 11]|uniref:DUF3579 domain-containing protein n=1 Tax=Bordetella genomosp. 11 TaxID=1416808 RepID=UPI0020CE286A|nr:DUF3579 domain-containing protein [Bordetella genomosp. 11]
MLTDGAPRPSPTAEPTVFRVRQLVILGVTEEGQRFRPSDWAERLAGVMAQFRPPGSAPASPLYYSPYVLPVIVDGYRSVVVDERLRELEPLAWKFVMDFATDNHLKTEEREIAHPS